MATCSCFSTSRVARQTGSQAGGEKIQYIYIGRVCRDSCFSLLLFFPLCLVQQNLVIMSIWKHISGRKQKQKFFVFLQYNPTPKLPCKCECLPVPQHLTDFIHSSAFGASLDSFHINENNLHKGTFIIVLSIFTRNANVEKK